MAIRLMAAWESVKIVTLSGVVSICSCVQGPSEGSTFCIVGFLVIAHVGFNTHPALAALPHNRISSSSNVET